MFRLLKNSFIDFAGIYKQYITFAFIFMFMTSFLFFPLTSFIFNRMLLLMGSPTLINNEVYKIPLSSVGFSGLILISLIAIIAVFIQFGVNICIAQQKFFNKEILISEALLTTLAKSHKLIGLGLIPMIALLFVLSPFFSSPLNMIIGDFNWTIYVRGQLTTDYLSLFTYVVIFLLMIYLLLRWIFTLHGVLIEKKSIYQAIKQSMYLTKNNKLIIVVYLIVLNILLFLLNFSIVYLISKVPSVVTSYILGDLINYYLVTVSSFFSFLMSLLIIPINMLFLTRLFYQFMENEGENEDTLSKVRFTRTAIYERLLFRFFRNHRWFVIFIIFIYLTGMFFISHNVNENLTYLKWNVEVAAHRGDKMHTPENSMSSIRSAVEKNADVVEIDAQITQDDIVVLNHDLNLQRVAGVPYHVKDLTYEELQQYEIGSSFSEEFKGEKIPTLEEVLIEIEEAGIKAMIELKPDGTEEELAEQVVSLVEEYEMVDQVYVTSFNYKAIQEIRKHNEDIKIGQILFRSAGNLSRLDVDFYVVHQTLLTERFIKEARGHQRNVWVWSVNLERTIDEVLKYDIDGIIAADPALVLNRFGFSEEALDEEETD
ncbi:glycerophosphodiester phosphodiesterase family protein [Aquisalibacillus elongatus]|uniref:Glycerophosphoryl diester phosphodiesterase n=1 Tax=Aquisalibacillus elongatus TaxID=485577 RepID=A0A3N5CFM2_9BACI|nr:glycerophosphodiester phosphodiesterase family protein [Aquisalibacillus elongatus]RPF56151.1 glycerophosphoryl diester phosphodiesterase [Aquisalibacillus elongatus]